MKNILKKSLSCCLLFCSVLLCCTACGTEAESPDTIEDILNPNRKKQETETETTFDWFRNETEESETEYQNILFPETEIQSEATDASVQDVTELPSELPEESESEIITEISTEILSETFPETDADFSELAPAEETAPSADFYDSPETAPAVSTEPAATEISAFSPVQWESAYRTFLESKAFQRQVSAEVQEEDTRFLLLYLNDDEIPELFIQTTMEVLIYTYHNGQAVFVDSFYPSHYTYDFYYRPYHGCLGSLQGSVMSDGTYLEIYEYEESNLTSSGLSRVQTYCYPTRDYSYEIYTERGMNIDLEKAPFMDVHPDRQNNLGSSWVTVPDVLGNSVSVQRYELTEDSLNALFGEPETDLPEFTSETQENKYAFR
ncbi:MAG: hypothetical protein IJ642_02240 [Oscillospiraceae bacterium]|nr:hypothetical protein [Oscillospiraceae bacterium]